MYQIFITDSQDLLPVDEQKFREVAEFVLRDEGVRDAEISIALLNNAEIHTLNRQHLDHDYPTDVLSFLLEREDSEPTAESDRRGAGSRLEGEVILSTEMAWQVAKDFGWSPEAEVLLYLVHGLLHLAGYDDLTPEEQRLMRRRECEILAHWQLAPRYTESEPPPGGDAVSLPHSSVPEPTVQ